METFIEWLVEAHQAYIPQEVLNGYELAFKDELKKLIRRTQNPTLRAVLRDMIDCPLQDSKGNCRTFTDFIVGALIRNGIHHHYDMEAALQYILEKMLMDKTDKGEPRASLFGGFQERPGYIGGNPLLARFLQYLQWAINNIRKGKIPRLSSIAPRPVGTVSIGQGRQRMGDLSAGVSPDEIATPYSGERDFVEMIQVIEGLLRRKEGAYGFPLVDLFRAMLRGMSVDQQRGTFGVRRVRPARQAVIQTVEDYARSTQNYLLLRLLERIKALQAGEAPPPKRMMTPSAPRPVLTDQQRDYASLLSVLDRFNRPVGTADLGRYRRHWLEYPPRDASSGQRNRLEDVLARMVRDGVLRATPTRNGALVYSPGPQAAAYRQRASA